MNSFKLLIVEDSERDVETYRNGIDVYKDRYGREIDTIVCNTVKSALDTIDATFDGALVDLKLDVEGGEGNIVVEKLINMHFRIPIAILTGTPGDAELPFNYLGVYKKGETSFEDILDEFWGVHSSGITRIMGGRGIIENALNDVFRKNIIPQLNVWTGYGKADSIRTEKALLRHAISHLQQLLDDDTDQFFPEEAYIWPPLSENIRTGCIAKSKADNAPYVILNPACDLVVREGGEAKCERILLARVVNVESVAQVVLENVSQGKKSKVLGNAFRNNFKECYHWLPETSFFSGGFIDFRNLITVGTAEFGDRFLSHELQISPAFVKDIVARFSSYYARQGQPEIDYTNAIKSYFSAESVS